MGGQANLPNNIRAFNCGNCGKYISRFRLFKGESGGKKTKKLLFSNRTNISFLPGTYTAT